MKMTGSNPAAKRIIATCAPESFPDASFAENAIAPNIVAAATMVRSARCVAPWSFVIVCDANRGQSVPEELRLTSGIQYRDATRRDILDIVDFQLAMARETENIELNRHICTRGVEAVFEDRNLGRYFVAGAESDLVGSLLITPEWSDWRNGVVWWIQSVYVRPANRGRGVYAGLYGHVKRIAEGNETVKGIRLYVDRTNTAAQEVYRRLGMNGDHYQVFEWMKELRSEP